MAAPALAEWSTRYDHLWEVTRSDVFAYLNTLRGNPRESETTALRSLFSWAKRGNIIFRNPTARVTTPPVADGVWQPLRPDEIAEAVAKATTPQAQLFLILAAVHAARPAQIRTIQLEDIDLCGRRVRIAGRDRPLDDLTHQSLLDWLDYRRRRLAEQGQPAPAGQPGKRPAARPGQPHLDL